MEFFNFLRRESKEVGPSLLVLGGFVGVVNGLMIFALTTAGSKAAQNQQDFTLLAMALLCFAGYYGGKRYLLNKTTRVVERVVEGVRRRIVDRVRKADFESFEQLGFAPLLNAVSQHTLNISQAASAIMNASTALVMFVGAMLFIYMLSNMAFYIVVSSIAVVVLLFASNRKALMIRVEKDSDKDNDFVDGFQHMLTGFKELKMNSARSQDFYENFLGPLAERSRESKTVIGLMFNRCTVIANCSLFVVLASVIFLMPVLASEEVSQILPVSAVVLFVFSSLAEIVAVYPLMTKAVGSIREIDRIEERLKALVKSSPEKEPKDSDAIEFTGLEMKGVSYQYHAPGNGEGFALKDVDFEVNPGEIVFIIGGNGSGKSTLMKILAGLYPPGKGELRVNGHLVGDHNRQAYRNMFSAILSDFHLFHELYGMDEPDPQEVLDLLSMAELTDKTNIDGRHVVNLDLSTGQRKRLALVETLLEDKDVLLFDEWAAEQDPAFRKRFYHEILLNLKKQGKAIVAITHDDRYFDVADRVLQMEYGRIVQS